MRVPPGELDRFDNPLRVPAGYATRTLKKTETPGTFCYIITRQSAKSVLTLEKHPVVAELKFNVLQNGHFYVFKCQLCTHSVSLHHDLISNELFCTLQLTRQEFADIVKVVGRESEGQHLSWLFTALPTILLILLFILWCVAFILVILLFPDDAPSESNLSSL